MRAPRVLLITLTVALCPAVAGCGGGGEDSTTLPVETPDPLAKLPAHWHHLAGDGQGLALGVAPGWRHGAPCLGNSNHGGKPKHKGGKDRGGKKDKGSEIVVLCSPDLLTTVSIAVDRSSEALDVPVEEFASRAFAGLDQKRYGGTLGAGKIHRFGDLYDAVGIAGKGRIPASGFTQNVELIVLRREDLANFTVVVASNARRASGAERRQAERMVRTVRDEPVEGRAGGLAPTP